MQSEGGYDVAFVRPLEEKYVCPICKKALRDPVQTQCGDRFCSSCIEPVLRSKNPQCPLDHEPLSSGVFKDVCCRREIASLPCYCLFKKNDCPWMKELMYLEDHLTNCDYKDVLCANAGCDKLVPKNKLQQHMVENCAFKPSRCQHCGQHVPEADLEVHLQNCTKFPMTCNLCGTSDILRDKMEHHLAVECKEADRPCKFVNAGCSYKAKEDKMNEHYESQKTEHLSLMLELTSSQEQKEKVLTEKLEKIEQDNTSLQSQLSTHRETLAAATQDLRAYQTRLGKVEQTVGEQRREIGQLKERSDDSASSKPGKNEFSYQFEEIRTALTEQEVKIGALESELSRASVVSSGGPRSLASSSSTLERRLGRNEHQLALHDIQLAEHDLKIQMLEATSYDGTYIWKIDEFSRRHHEAIIGKTPSIYSPPFYVGRYGYKVCARVYANGDGMGKGTHLSLYFVIMKGEYDADIPWPFRQKVTFKLLDQDRQNDITDTFRPDPKSSSFKRPTSNMNIASGCPLFVSQQDLQSRCYVSDDTMFIKITVDTTALPPLGF